MRVAIALIVGALNVTNAANYYGIDKLTRESSADLAAVRVGVESTVVWLPYLKFLGIGMILAGITVALTVILRTLQTQEQLLAGFLEAKARGA